jgi:hypothetical protein
MSTRTTYLEITDVAHVGDYRLKITFNDGHVSVVDFEPFLSKSHHPAIRKYLEKKTFLKWTFEHGDVHWNDYDLIFPIADLYAGEIS